MQIDLREFIPLLSGVAAGLSAAFGRSGAVASQDTMGNRNGILSIAVAGLLCTTAAGAPAQDKSSDVRQLLGMIEPEFDLPPP
jgi:hypothetical protein